MEPRPARSAAALVLHRRPAGGSRPQLYWVRRGDAVPFMAGFHAFPGGAADRADAEIAAGNGEPGAAGSDHRDTDPSRVTALRECFEETGVLFARNAGRIGADLRREWRRRLLLRRGAPGSASFADFVRETGMSPDPSPLIDAGHWITPPFAPIRFDTRYFLAEVPPGETPEVIPGELAEGGWIAPADALAEWERGRALVAPPVLHLLRVAAAIDDPSRWPEAARGIPEARGGEVTRIEMRHGTLLVPLRTPTLPPATHTNCYVVGGARPVVIDPGASDPAEARALDDLLAALTREGRRPSRIAVTHHHHDHVGGVEALRARLGIPVCAHPETRDRLAGAVTVDECLSDGATLDTGAAPLRAVHTPGHARGHLAFVEESTRSLFSGDLILGMGTTVIDPPDGDMADYVASLDRLAGMELRALFPGHGPVLAESSPKIREYRAHRDERERQVQEALAAGCATPEAIVQRVYADVPALLHPFAARSVLAHLEWLEAKGRARRAADGSWQHRPDP